MNLSFCSPPWASSRSGMAAVGHRRWMTRAVKRFSWRLCCGWRSRLDGFGDFFDVGSNLGGIAGSIPSDTFAYIYIIYTHTSVCTQEVHAAEGGERRGLYHEMQGWTHPTASRRSSSRCQDPKVWWEVRRLHKWTFKRLLPEDGEEAPVFYPEHICLNWLKWLKCFKYASFGPTTTKSKRQDKEPVKGLPQCGLDNYCWKASDWQIVAMDKKRWRPPMSLGSQSPNISKHSRGSSEGESIQTYREQTRSLPC